MNINMFLTTTGATTPSFFETYGTIIFLVLMLGVMYLTVVIPQRKEEKARNELRNSLEEDANWIRKSVFL